MNNIDTAYIASTILDDIDANGDAFSERPWDYVTDFDAGEYYFSFAGYTDPTPMTSPEIVRVTLTIYEHLSANGLYLHTNVRIIAQGDKITFNVTAKEVSDE